MLPGFGVSSSVLVGGSGFIGSHVALALAAAGTDVVVLDVAVPSADVAEVCRYEACDVTERESLRGALDDADVVYLTAALLAKQCDENPKRCLAVNVAGTVHALTEVIAARRKPRVVFLSTGAVYATATTYPIGEEAATQPGSLYALSKLAGEHAVAAAAAAGGFSAAVLRLFTVYGPGPASGRRGHFVAGWLERAAEGRALTIFGDGEQTVDLTHVSDVAEACRLAAVAPIGEGDCRVYNIGSGAETRVRDVARWVREVLPSLDVENVPPQWIAPPRQFADIGRARSELGYAPAVSPETGLKTLFRERLVYAGSVQR